MQDHAYVPSTRLDHCWKCDQPRANHPSPMLIADPGHGVGFRIESLWAFIAVHDDGDEGVCAILSGGTALPMIAADRERLDQLRPLAERLAREGGKPIRLVRFYQREEVEVLE